VSEPTAAVSRVLFELWDPMGVRAEDPRWPPDEYEGYAAGVLELVLHRASDDVVAEHLAAIESEWMGLQPSPLAHRLRVAQAVRAALGLRREGDRAG
jgi:hypothetical protein